VPRASVVPGRRPTVYGAVTPKIVAYSSRSRIVSLSRGGGLSASRSMVRKNCVPDGARESAENDQSALGQEGKLYRASLLEPIPEVDRFRR
jgi:hypothetical protein